MHFFRLIVLLPLPVGLVLLGNLLQGGQLRALYHPMPLILVLGMTFGFMVFSYSLNTIGKNMLVALNSREASLPLCKEARDFFATMGRYALVSALLGSVGGLAYTVYSLNSPEKIGIGVVFCLFSLLYGFFFQFFFAYPLENNINERVFIGQTKPLTNSEDKSNYATLGIMVSLITLPLMILLTRNGNFQNFILPILLFSASGPLAAIIMSNFSYRGRAFTKLSAFKLSVMADAAIASGLIAFIVGLIHVFQNLSNVDQMTLGLTMISIAPFYSLMAFSFFKHLEGQVRRARNGSPLTPFMPHILSFGLVVSVALLLAVFISP